MRTPSKSIRMVLFSAIAVGTTARLLESPSGAQPDTVPATMPSDATGSTDLRVDLQIDETTVRDYVDHLAQITNGNFILLNEPGIDPATIRMPALRLRQMTVESAVHLLTVLPGTKIDVEPDPGATVPTYLITVHAKPVVVGGLIVDPTAAPRNTRIFSLERLLFTPPGQSPSPIDRRDPAETDQRISQALQLIDAALQMQTEAGPVAIVQFHAGTRTLLVRGTAPQIAAVEEALAALAPPPLTDEETSVRRDVTQQLIYDAEVQRLNEQVRALQYKLAGGQLRAPTTQP